jgi:hypothetical protein
MHKHKVGNAVQFYADADAEPRAALIAIVHGDSKHCVDLIVWHPMTHGWKAHNGIPHAANANLDGPFWICPDETDEID